MMRPLFSLAFCGAILAPGAAMAQPVLAPLPTIAPTEPVAPPATAAPPPIAVAGVPPPQYEAPEKVAPVIIAKEPKDGGAGEVVGTAAVGVAGGAAGAAVAGPIGKFAGGFVAKRIARGLFGKKDKTPSLTVIPQTPAAAPLGTVLAEER